MPIESATGKLNGAITPNTPYGTQHVHVALALHEAVERLRVALVLLHVAGVGLDQVDGLLHLEDRLGARLAGLEARQRGELHVPLADSVGGRAQQPAALLVGVCRPSPARGRTRGLDGAAHELLPGLASAARHPVRVRRVAPLERARPPRRSSAADQVRARIGVRAARRLERLLERGVGLGAEVTARVSKPRAHRLKLTEPRGTPEGSAGPLLCTAPRCRAGRPRPTATTGQRGWNRQPAGMRVGSGVSPRRICGSMCCVSGTTDSSARVYGWRGSSSSCSVGPVLDDPAEVHHGHAVGDVPGQPEVVRHDEDRRRPGSRTSRA